MSWLGSYLEQIQVSGTAGTVALAAVFVLVAVVMAVKGWRS